VVRDRTRCQVVAPCGPRAEAQHHGQHTRRTHPCRRNATRCREHADGHRTEDTAHVGARRRLANPVIRAVGKDVSHWVGTGLPIASVMSKGEDMARETVDVLIDDLDGSAAAETVRIGWNGEWRELELSKRNLAALSRSLDRYWDVARPASADGQTTRRRRVPAKAATRARKSKRATGRDPKLIRAWAMDNGISVPARGRIPGHVERQYEAANGR
jgi:nucleoid-associated protein Lsr2